MNIKCTLVGLASLLGLVSCTQAPESLTEQYGSGALGGSSLAQDFGGATSNNIGVQNAKNQLEMVKNLTRLFAAQTPATINFDFNKSSLDENAKSQLRQQAAWIKSRPAITFRVFGHTDKVGGNSFNRRLGQRRAQTAVNYLISQGVDRRKVEAVVSFGETRPLVLTETRNRENRRTVTEVKGFFNPSGSGLIDGKVASRIYTGYIGESRGVIPELHCCYPPKSNGGGVSAAVQAPVVAGN